MSDPIVIPDIPAKMGEAGAHQEQLYVILSAMKTRIEGNTTKANALETAADNKVAANQAACTATDVAGVLADINTLIAALKTAGLMAADTPAE